MSEKLFTLPLNLKEGEDLHLDTVFPQQKEFVKNNRDLVKKFINRLSDDEMKRVDYRYSGDKSEYLDVVDQAGFPMEQMQNDHDFIEYLSLLMEMINDNVDLFNSVYSGKGGRRRRTRKGGRRMSRRGGRRMSRRGGKRSRKH
jgi:hypothetical protein